MPDPGTHACPGCRAKRLPEKQVSDSVFACKTCWFELPPPIRRDISRTVSKSILSAPRRAAMDAARHHWETAQV